MSFPCVSGPLSHFCLHCSQSNLSKMQMWTCHCPTWHPHMDLHLGIKPKISYIQTSRDRSRFSGAWTLCNFGVCVGSFLIKRSVKFWIQNKLQGLRRGSASEVSWSINFTNFLVYLALLRELFYHLKSVKVTMSR